MVNKLANYRNLRALKKFPVENIEDYGRLIHLNFHLKNIKNKEDK